MNPVLPSWFFNSAPSRVGHSKKFLTWAPLGTQGTIGHPKPSRDKNENRKVRKSQWSNKFQLVSTSFNCNCEELWSNSLTDYEATFNRQDSVNSQSQHVTTCHNSRKNEPMSPDSLMKSFQTFQNWQIWRHFGSRFWGFASAKTVGVVIRSTQLGSWRNGGEG